MFLRINCQRETRKQKIKQSIDSKNYGNSIKRNWIIIILIVVVSSHYLAFSSVFRSFLPDS
jgi:hypothetical protein